MNTLEDWELFEITHETSHDYILKAIEWHENADKKLKSTFYTGKAPTLSYHKDILALLCHEDILAQSERQMQRIAKDFLEQGTLSSHQQRKYAKRASLLDDDIKKELKANIFSKSFGVPIPISEKTTRKFMELWSFYKKTIG
ncbi:8479_t:CDS:2 [Gigaspora rosea]|nr:8479_t:CDS:2 [Gigaspora rosea]